MADDIGGGRATRSNAQLDMAGIETNLGFRLKLAQQYVFREFVTRFNPLGVSPTHYSALMLIEKNPDCRQTELAAALGMRQPNLLERIDALVERGLVSRSPDPDDRRANVLRLTSEGSRFMTELHKTHEMHTRQLVDQLGEDGYAQLVELLKKLG